MQILNIIAVVAATFTGQPCTAIDNGVNAAVFAIPNGRVVRANYRDYGTIGYDRPVPRAAWNATRMAEYTLTHGRPGHKVAIACAN